jgi:16S rRNA (guanine1516-N2)-methyltransferase
MTIPDKKSIAVVCFSKLRQQQAKEFCLLNKLPLLKMQNDQYDLQLLFHDDLVELFDKQLKTTLSIDFLKGTLAHRQQFGGGRGQAIAKAIGLKSGATPNILDTTAGLAGDAFVLATLGCPVTMIERSSVVYTLIENAIERASLSDKFQTILKQGFQLINCDANDYIKQQLSAEAKPPDVIYIDPMYPHRKKSALVKKDMQILQRLHGKNDNSADLLENALLYANKRVVVKRPLHADSINNRTANTCIKSKKTRYDIYTIEKM